MMMHVNRGVAIIEPKRPFMDWINQLPGSASIQISLKDLRKDCLAVLIPDLPDEDSVQAYVGKMHRALFEEMLFSW